MTHGYCIGDAGSAETVEVLLTGDTENTGTTASVSSVTSGSNSGDGSMVVTANGFDTASETRALSAASLTSRTIAGSISGNQRDITLDSASSSTTYTIDNREITLTDATDRCAVNFLAWNINMVSIESQSSLLGSVEYFPH